MTNQNIFRHIERRRLEREIVSCNKFIESNWDKASKDELNAIKKYSQTIKAEIRRRERQKLRLILDDEKKLASIKTKKKKARKATHKK